MLDCSKGDIEVLNTGMKTTESNDCRGMSGYNRDVNSVLAMTRKRARLFYKDEQKFINLFIQSISRLCWASQLYPRTKE